MKMIYFHIGENMFSLNLANVAIGSALAIMPFSFSQQNHNDIQTIDVCTPKLGTMNAELRETVIVADTLLGAFYTIASSDHAVFDSINKADMLTLFQQAENLSQTLRSFLSEPNDLKLLQSYTQTLEKVRELYRGIEYKKEADRVLLSRVNSSVAMSFDENSTEEEIRRAIFGA